MKQTLMIKLTPTPEQYEALVKTMEAFNQACNYASKVAFDTKTFGQFYIHRLIYHELRQRFGLSAQMTIRAVAQVSESYKVSKVSQHEFKPRSSMVYDQRILSWKGLDKVSILSLDGRLIIPTRIGAYQEARLDRKIRQSDLILRDGVFYLAVGVDAPEPTPDEPDGFLGVDLGIVNIVADSDGKAYSGAQVNGLRKRHTKLRGKLQAKGTKQAKRLLKKRSRKEARFASNINHTISKSIVAKAKDTGRGIALEDLGGIRDRITVRKSQRRQQHSWAFNQLRAFIEYKAKLVGVVVQAVDPRNTSRTCPVCGCIDKRNRASQALFSCISCGYSAPADILAARIIASRAAVNQPYISTTYTWLGTMPCALGTG
jgi:IS605 OrfB family transposase